MGDAEIKKMAYLEMHAMNNKDFREAIAALGEMYDEWSTSKEYALYREANRPGLQGKKDALKLVTEFINGEKERNYIRSIYEYSANKTQDAYHHGMMAIFKWAFKRIEASDAG